MSPIVDQNLVIIVVAIAVAGLVALVAIIGGLLSSRRERFLTHTERMKALEVGRDLPDRAADARLRAVFGRPSDDEDGSMARKCYSTALWVAFWGFGAAIGGGHVHDGVAYFIASSVGAIGVTAVICGTVLAARESASPRADDRAKPAVDADAFDVVSARG